MKRKATDIILLCMAVLTITSPAAAHDYWLEPETSQAQPNSQLPVRLFVGMDLTPEKEHPYETQRTESFTVMGPGALETKPVEGGKPFCTVPTAESGDIIVGLVRKLAHIELTAEQFNDYVTHEGLRYIYDIRTKNGTLNRPARENYTRYIKAIARTRTGDGRIFTEPLGYRLEIVPMSDPLGLAAGAPLPIKVLFEGRPLAGATVFCYGKNGTSVSKSSVTTGRDGTADAAISGPGLWSLRLIHMRECAGCKDADWESFWASLTFHVAARGASQHAGEQSIPFGNVTLEQLLETSPEWQDAADAYQPDPASVAYLRRIVSPVTVQVYYGHWCSDSKAHVPALVKTLMNAGNPSIMADYWSVPRRKEGEERPPVNGRTLTAVPTFVVFVNGVEAGSIIETPAASVEKDLVAIIEKAQPELEPEAK
ncbi:MAG: DUF4198 domain-containing protein [Acidobacteriota bacterium]